MDIVNRHMELYISKINMRGRIVKYSLFLILILSFCHLGFSQEFTRHSLKTGVGLGINEGQYELGIGGVVLLGYQNSFWKDRLRISPNIVSGNFMALGISDVRDQYYRVTSLNLIGYLDVIKYKAFSILIGAGGSLNFSRGLLGTGGDWEVSHSESEYFLRFYNAGYLGIGIRINPRRSRVAYEISPINVHFGKEYFFTEYFKFGIDIKFKAKESDTKD
jgi:hypothetical protein